MSQQFTAIYMRVSTESQDLRSQEPDLNKWAEGQENKVRWFRDKFTGKIMDRPGFNTLMEAVRGGSVAAVVVWRLDRLGRTAKGLTALFDELRERKIDLVSLRDGFTLSTPAGRLQAQILASVSEYETEIRAERILAGQAVAKANGIRWGGSRKGWHAKRNLEKIPTVVKLAAEGTPKAQIARITGLARGTIYAILGKHSENAATGAA